MPKAIALREDYSVEDLRRLACQTQDANQARRLLALAAVLEGKSRAEAAALGGAQAQTLREWVIAFNSEGPDGLLDSPSPGRPPKLSPEQKQTLAEIVTAGPDPETDGVVRWRCVDLQVVIQDRFDVGLCESAVNYLLKELGFSHVSARPQHPRQDPDLIEDFKKKYAWANR